MDERTKALMEVVMLTKARIGAQFLEQLDLYRKGKHLAVVSHFSEDQQERYSQLVAAVAVYGADEVVHAAEAWMRSVSPEQVGDYLENYRHGDMANDPTERSEVLIVTRMTKHSLDVLLVPFSEQEGELVYGETEDAMSDGVAPVGMVTEAIGLGLEEAWQYTQPPHLAAQTVASLGLLVFDIGGGGQTGA